MDQRISAFAQALKTSVLSRETVSSPTQTPTSHQENQFSWEELVALGKALEEAYIKGGVPAEVFSKKPGFPPVYQIRAQVYAKAGEKLWEDGKPKNWSKTMVLVSSGREVTWKDGKFRTDFTERVVGFARREKDGSVGFVPLRGNEETIEMYQRDMFMLSVQLDLLEKNMEKPK
jgi:hypothetical protein